VIAMARSSQGHAADANRAANAALALCRQAGDLYGSGNARNMLVFNEPDIAAQLPLLHLALIDFEAAGYLERQGVITHNLGVAYNNLGLYRRARRLMLNSFEIYRRTGARGALGTNLGGLAEAELAMGHRDSTRAYCEEMARVAEALDEPLITATVPTIQGRLALLEGDAVAALRHFERSEQLTRGGELEPSRNLQPPRLFGVGARSRCGSRVVPCRTARATGPGIPGSQKRSFGCR
jgi:tetratricopeptide (TPR) repeat protein